MPDLKLFDWRLDTAIANTPSINFTPRYFPVPPMPMKVVLEADEKAYKMLDGDLRLQQILSAECKSVFDILVPAIVQKLQALDNACETVDLKKYSESRKATYRSIEMHIDSARQFAQKKAIERWERIQREEQKYNQATLRFAVKVIKGTFEVITGALAVAAAVPTGGATLGVAIVGGYQGCAELGVALAESYLSAEEVRKSLESDLKSLKGTYASSHNKGVAREIIASGVNEVLKVPVRANVSTLDDKAKLWEGKLGHLRKVSRTLSEELNKLLEQADRLEEHCRNNPGDTDSVKKAAAVSKKVATILDDGVEVKGIRGGRLTIPAAHQGAERGLEAHKKVVAEIKALQDGRSSLVDVADKLIALVADGAMMALGGIEKASDVKDVLKPLYDVVSESVPAVKKVEEGIKGRIETARITEAKHLKAT